MTAGATQEGVKDPACIERLGSEACNVLQCIKWQGPGKRSIACLARQCCLPNAQVCIANDIDRWNGERGRLAPIHGELSEIVSTNPPFAPIVDHRSVLAPRAPKSFHDTGAHCFSCALAREEKLGQALNELNGL